MKETRWLLPIVLLFSASCAEIKATDEDKFLAFALDRHISQEKEWISCLSVNGKDPTPAVLSLVKDKGKSLYDVKSNCTFVPDKSGSYHNRTKKKAMFLNVTILARTNPDTYVVSISEYHHGLFGGAQRLEFKKNGDDWMVSRTFGMIVS